MFSRSTKTTIWLILALNADSPKKRLFLAISTCFFDNSNVILYLSEFGHFLLNSGVTKDSIARGLNCGETM